MRVNVETLLSRPRPQVDTVDVNSKTFTYNLISNKNTSGHSFVVSAATGAITLGSGNLDYEVQAKYKLTIETTDGGLNDDGLNLLTTSTIVHVNIINVNEMPSLGATKDFWVQENALAGAPVG